MIDKVCEKSKCTACFACQNVCPTEAIKLGENSEGLVYPLINEKCVNCGLCQKICPVNSPVQLKAPLSAYAFYSKNEEIRKSSTSGGLIYSAAMAFDGIVYGTAYGNNLEVECMRFDNKDELYKTQSSKYVLSFINNQYKSVKADLESGKRVLFISTPCQLAGLKSFLNKEYLNLYTIDFVCHGVCERKTLKDYISNEAHELDLKNARVRFRDGKGYHMTLWNDDNCIDEIPFNQNFYFHGFLEGWSLRENCHSCPYATIKRCSDLTACDCWSSQNKAIKREMKRGLNGVLVNTEKGNELLNSVNAEAEIIESSIDEAQSGISQLKYPSPHSKYSRRFQSLNKKHGSYYALKNTVLKKKIIFKLRKIKNACNSNN